MKIKSFPPKASAFGLVALLCLSVIGCTTKTPAPIVNRTGPGTSAPRPATPAPVVAATPQAVTPPVAVTPDVQTSPIRSGTIDSRPLETKPLDTKPPVVTNSTTTTAPPVVPSASGAVAPNVMRTQPKGLKRPYSDTLMAELKAADGPVIAPVVAAVEPKIDPKVAEAKPSDSKSTEAKPNDAKPTDAKLTQLAWPAAGKLIQSFGKEKSTGMAFTGKLGDPISAAADGKVIFSNTTLPQYGKMIIVKHDDDTHSVYAHNKTLLVKEGQQVKRGQKIAELGDSGTTEPKLYFEVRKQGKPVDPQKLLPARP
jgi:lipoprotein NlpD